MCGVLEDPPQGSWSSVNCKAKGSFIKIQARPNKYLHFCGLKIWSFSSDTIIVEEEIEEPEAADPVTTTTGTTVVAESISFRDEWISVSSYGKERKGENKPWNPIAYGHFDANYFSQRMTCFSTK